MKLDTFIQNTSNLYAENRLLKFAVACLAIAVMVSAGFSYSALEYQRVVILPPVVDKRIVISGTEVNDDYIRLFTRYAMTLLNNYTPASAPGQFDELMSLASPEFHPDLQQNLYALADTIEKLSLTSTFFPQSIRIDPEDHLISVTGMQKRFAGATAVEDGQKTYEIAYLIINGRFYIDGIQEVDPR